MPYSPPFRTSLGIVLIFSFFSYHLLALAHAKTVSRIIDDTYGDEATGYLPVYYPHDSWVWRRNCNSEQGCEIVPDDENKIQNKTWTAATYRTNMTAMGLTLQFEGTAISVYFIQTNDIGKNNTRITECNFTLDGTLSYQFVHEPTSERGFDYNYEAYRATALANKQHTLDIATGILDHQVYISFDYARYTTEISDDPNSTNISPSPSPSNTTVVELKKRISVGVIVGAVVGGVGLLCIVAVTLLLILRRKRRSSHPHDQIPKPYPGNPPPEMNQIKETREQLRSLQTQKRRNIDGLAYNDSDSPPALREIRHIQAQIDSLQNQSRVQLSVGPSELPPSYRQVRGLT
ncbi:hypothetical protein E1B28_012694 [Marasmius oreades]|uniref:Uncharacterized protein n=1 Tax=Marasmius oreades TaxID=181124 RepID=A0A9P7UQ70_9AGAR|nr:uncharacterized protein E1B28_012694 [Marasmius oreades]KAG7088726.1 hypothetical protein E1B28_012694 [Marasmius oreades]